MFVDRSQPVTRVAIIGYGAIGNIVVSHLARSDEVSIVAVAVKPGSEARTRQELPSGVEVVSSPSDIVETSPDIVAECAGHDAVRCYGQPVLARGIDLLVISTGVLADDAERGRLNDAALRGHAKLVLPAGAIAGIDGLTALRQGGLDWVRYTSTKPPHAWQGTPADDLVDLALLRKRTVLFRGSARRAALLYPRNANIAATVALAGKGFDETEVRLVADPDRTSNAGLLEAAGPAGTIRVEAAGPAAAENAKTSIVTAHSVVSALLSRSATIVI